MDIVTLARPNADDCRSAGERAQLALAGVIGCTGDADFGATALAQLNRAIPISWLSVYRLYPDKPPEIFASGAYGVPDGTRTSWHSYRNGLYKRDSTFHATRDHVGRGETVITRWHAHEIPADHRKPIYTRHSLSERASLATSDGPDRLFAVNLYRSQGQKEFDSVDFDVIRGWGAPLLAAVRCHVRLVEDRLAHSAFLQELPRREREVCLGMLKGMTYEGIGADLGISPGTVKTYRDRAFEKFGLHHRNELFAMALAGPSKQPVLSPSQ